MKKITKLIAALCVAAMAMALAACGGGGAQPAETQAPAEAVSEAAAEAVTEAAAEVSEAASEAAAEVTEAANEAANAAAGADVSNPSIVIEFGDAAGIEELAKKAQNFEVEEGTAAKISGVFNTGISTPSVQEKTDDGAVGINLYVDGDWEMPGDGVEIDVVGTFVKGQYFMEFHALPENITIK